MNDQTPETTVESPPKMTLPVVFNKCPHCGGTKLLARDYLNQLRDEGAIHKDSFKGSLQHQIPLVDQAHPPTILAQVIKIKVLVVQFDVCADCGTMYCVNFECKEAPAQMQPMPPQPAQGFRNFPGQKGGFR